MKKLLPILVLASLLAPTACEEMYDPPGTTPPRWPDLTSPANVLKTVEISFNERNIDFFKSTLGPNFVFYFDPREVGQRPPGEPHYKIPGSRTDFLHAVKNMFDQAYSITLSIPTGRVGMPAENETTYGADNINLSILVMADEVNGYVADGYCNFEFESYPTKERKKNWRITNWWDRTSPVNGKSNGIKPMSLGRVLALYYPE